MVFISITNRCEVFPLKPDLLLHSSYQDFVMERLQKHYIGGILVLVKNDWPLITKLWITDLSPITTKLQDFYGDAGSESRDPASMMRCFLLGLQTHPTEGITEWVNILRRTPLYAILRND